MSDTGFSNPVAVAGMLLANTTPQPDLSLGNAGTADTASRSDHRHMRFASIGEYVLGADGTLLVAFTRTFPVQPVVFPSPIRTTAGEQALYLTRGDFTQDGQGNYTGVTIIGARTQPLPSLAGLLLVSNLVAALGNFNVVGGSAAGGRFALAAFLPTTSTT